MITDLTGLDWGAIGVQFPTNDRGRVTSMWHIPREAAEQLIQELTERWGAPRQHGMVSGEVLDEIHRVTSSATTGVTWVNFDAD